MRIVPALIIGAAVIMNSGCASIGAHEEHAPKGPYSGVRRWPAEVRFTFDPKNGTPFPDGLVAVPFLLVDLPLSFGLDTMVLPADLLPKKSGSDPAK